MITHRVGVTGSRDFDDYFVVQNAIHDAYFELYDYMSIEPQVVVFVHGKCDRGTDAMCGLIVREMKAAGFRVEVEEHPADWLRYGRAAGPIRNSEMVADGADRWLAFYKQGAGNRGTDDCACKAEAAGIPVRRFTA